MYLLGVRLRILHILLILLSAEFCWCQARKWNFDEFFKDVDFFDPENLEFGDEPFPPEKSKFTSDYSYQRVLLEPHFKRFSPYRSRECQMKYELIDPHNIEQTRKLTEGCSESLVSCYSYHLSKYRTIDGSCNNVRNPSWGKAKTCLRRILPYDYADGKSVPRESCTRKPLPNARLISNVFNRETKVKKLQYTTQLVSWGSILTHDLSLNDVYSKPDSVERLNCCESGPVTDDKCISIPVPKGDLLLTTNGVTCLNVIRTIPCLCNTDVLQHLNQKTAYHDLSLLYGSDEDEAWSLRTGSQGMLKTQYNPKAGQLLPGVQTQGLCVAQNYSAQCFKSGDVRANQDIFIVAMLTMFVRYHNFLCHKLHEINSRWDDEKLYQEARRLFIAQAQMITFGQYLPIILGDFMKKEGLNVLPGARYTEYDPTLDASIADEYATVAARYGHSIIPNSFSEINTKTGRKTKQLVADYYHRPFRFYDGQYDKVLKGTTVDKIRKTDVFLASSVRDNFNRRVYLQERAGLDLGAISILRGRDHGIPGYTYYLKHLFNITVRTFDDLRKTLPPKSVELLKEIYESVHDVEMHGAGLAEYYVKGGYVGPTFASILTRQYKRLKFGDRYWFEHGNQAGSFTPDQLLEIKKTSLARIMCETTDIKSIQEFVFLPPSSTNPVIPCEKIPKLNLWLWKDRTTTFNY